MWRAEAFGAPPGYGEFGPADREKQQPWKARKTEGQRSSRINAAAGTEAGEEEEPKAMEGTRLNTMTSRWW